jgi:general secretion pathway protein L
VLVLPAHSLSWHKVQLPKTPKHQVRAVLEGLLEDRLLEDVSAIHFALGPAAQHADPDGVWVCTCNKPWLQQLLAILDQAESGVQRIIPEWAPSLGADTNAPQVWAHAVQGEAHLSLGFSHGTLHLPLEHTPPAFLHQLFAGAPGVPEPVSGQATPDTLATAEAALSGFRWSLQGTGAQWLQMARLPWNLAQFDVQLAQNRHAGHRLLKAWRQLWQAPAWRPVRWGLGLLVAMQMVGLNAMAWSLNRQLVAVQLQTQTVLQQTFPHITLVLDAPLQMARELTRLKQAQGQVDGQAFESLLQTLGQAQQATWQGIRYDGQQVLLRPAASGEALASLQAALAGSSWQISPSGTENGSTRLVMKARP